MKKAVVTIAVGKEFQRLEKCTGPFRKSFAERHGWDYIIETEPLLDSHTLGLYKACNLSKLLLPNRLLDYDLVVYMDCDTIVSLDAPCLSAFYDSIPKGGFAAGQTISFENRKKLYPAWTETYYTNLKTAPGHEAEIKQPKLHINGGLLLFKPKEVVERWSMLAQMNSSLNEESLLNIYELQNGRCFILPPNWHVLWKYYRDEHYPRLKFSNFFVRAIYKLTGITVSNPFEQRCFLATLRQNYFIHLAFEHNKAYYLINRNFDRTS